MTTDKDRLIQLNNTLNTIRDVGRLINHEKDMNRLLDGVCQLITHSRGYHSGWISLLSEDLPTGPFFHTGFGKSFHSMTDYLNRGNLPPCAIESMKNKSLTVIEDPENQCEGCPFQNYYSNRSSYTKVLIQDNQIMGWISTSIPREMSSDKEEQGLFSDMADDIAFALKALRTEKSLNESDERFKMLFKKAPLGYQALNENAIFLEVNDAWLETLGYERFEVIGHWFGEFLAPEYVEPFEKRFPIFKEQGKIHSEFYMIHKNGERRYIVFEGRIGHTKDGQFLQTHCIINDQTNKKKIEDALLESEAHLRNIFENISSCVAVYEPQNGGENFIFVDINRSGEINSHLKRNEIIGKKITDVFPNVEEMGLMENLRKALNSGEPQYQPMTEYRDSRISTIVENYITRLPSGRIMSLYEDRTEYYQMQERLRQSEKMEAIGKLAGGIAHDFNNILCGIIGFTELTRESENLDEDQKRNMDQILQAGDRAQKLVNQILSFSRQQSDNKSPLYLTKHIKEALSFLKASLPSSIKIDQNIRGDVFSVKADPVKIHEILINLCTNGAYAMENRGILEVNYQQIHLENLKKALPDEIPPGEYALLNVKDKGHGIPLNLFSRIFDPFFTTKDVGEGTGMGLSVVFGIVKDHKGYIVVESQPGKGSDFQIYFPRTKSRMIREEQLETHLPRGREKILFVDDEKMINDLMSRVIGSLDYEITTMKDSDEAWKHLEKDPHAYDLVITDLTMPGLSGLELANHLYEIRPDLPIILCSGYSPKDQKSLTAKENIRAYCKKPFSYREMARTIRWVLDKKLT